MASPPPKTNFLDAARAEKDARQAAASLAIVEKLLGDRDAGCLETNPFWRKWSAKAPDAAKQYWRLQHFYCALHEEVANMRISDGQKQFKEQVWQACDPDKRGLAHKKIGPSDIDAYIFDWIAGLRTDFQHRVKLNQAAHPTDGSIWKSGPSLVAAAPEEHRDVMPWARLALEPAADDEDPFRKTAYDYLQAFPTHKGRPEDYITHEAMMIPLLARPVPDDLDLTDSDEQKPFFDAEWEALGRAVLKLRSAEAAHREWVPNKAKSEARASTKLQDPLAKAVNALREFGSAASQYELAIFGAPSRHELLVIQNGRVRVMRLVQAVVALVTAYRQGIEARTRTARCTAKQHDLASLRLAPMFWMCPRASALSWDEAQEAIAERDDTPDDAWGAETLLRIAKCFPEAPVVRLKDLKSAHRGFKPSCEQKDMIAQLVTSMPLLCVQLRLSSGRCSDKNVLFLSVADLKGFTASYFWSLLIQIDEQWRGDEIDPARVALGKATDTNRTCEKQRHI